MSHKEPAPTDAAVAEAARRAGTGRESLIDFADEMARLAETREVAAPARQLHLVTFYLDREEFGVPIERVREVVRVPDITRVPEAPPHIRGVVNLRGRILPVVELRTRLGLAPLEVTARSRLVVADSRGRRLGMLVDRSGQVLKVPESAVIPPPPDAVSAHTDYVTGVARLETRLIILLDLDRALLLAEPRLEAPPGA